MAKKNKVIENTVQNNSATTDNKNYFDVLAMVLVFSIMLIDFFPQFGSLEIIAPQYLYLSIINIACGLFIYKNPELLSNSLFHRLRESLIIKSYLLFLGLCTVSIFTANNFSLALMNLVQLLIVGCLAFNIAVFLNNRLYLIYNIALLIAAFVLIEGLVALNSFFTVVKTDSMLAALSQLKGNTGNINIFAASITGRIPFLLLAILHFKDWKKWFVVFSLFLSAFLVLLTASRASYIALFIIVVSFIIVQFILKSERKDKVTVLSAVLIPLVVAFAASSYMFSKSEDTGRFASISSRVATINPVNSTDGSVNVRLKYWDNALKIANENPVFGIGLGNWKIESLPYEKEISNRLTVSDHPHNDFLEIAAETGYLNLIVYLSIFVFALVISIKRIRKNDNELSQMIAFITLLLLFAYGIDALFNFPLYRATMQLNFVLLLVLSLLNTVEFEESTVSSKSQLTAAIIVSLGLFTCYFSYATFKSFQFENDTIIDLAQVDSPRKYSYTDIVNRLPSFPNVANNSQPYVEVAAIYALGEKRFDQALKYFNQAEKINPYTGRSSFYKYRLYQETQKPDSAAFYARKAFDTRPRNEDYYLTALVVEAAAKDTTAILKVHNRYTQYVKEPSVWINTSSALAQSRYPNDYILKFIDKGLALFPKDSTLIERKKSFQRDALLAKSASSTATVAITALVKANNYAAKSDFKTALQFYKQAAIEDPKNSIITQNIGICYFKTNQFKSAIIYLEKALNSPLLTDGKTEFILGASYLNTNNKEKGCKYLIEAENKNYPEAAKIVAQYCN